MKNRRILCLVLLFVGGISVAGYNAEVLGTPFFFVGIGCFAMALVLFISGGSRAAEAAPPQPIPVAEPDPPPPLPTVHREPVRDRTDRVVEIDPGPIDGAEFETEAMQLTEVNDLQAIEGTELETGEIDLTETEDSEEKQDPDFQVTSDISLPVELQNELSLSDQLDRLKRLFDSGGLTEEEYRRAKSKLLA